MKSTQILPIILATVLFSGCNFIVPSESSRRDNNQSAEAENSEIQANTKSQQTNTRTKTVANQAAKPKAPAANAVCPRPDKPCNHKEKEFAEWELSFKLPAKIQPNKTISSAPFYAVLLNAYESVEDCDGGEFIEEIENERKRLQKSQLERKVFASYGCPNMDAVGYDFEGRHDAAKEMVLIDNFIAIYAGETKEEAEELRKQLLDEYPKAVVKRMTANWERIVQ